MTRFGQYLSKKSIKKAEVSRKTGISPSRLSELALNESTNLKAEELYLIAMAIDVNPLEILEVVYKDVKLLSAS
jgi:DNA-binding Xre family transcriptional regulator